jgi:hypothetical protein
MWAAHATPGRMASTRAERAVFTRPTCRASACVGVGRGHLRGKPFSEDGRLWARTHACIARAVSRRRAGPPRSRGSGVPRRRCASGRPWPLLPQPSGRATNLPRRYRSGRISTALAEDGQTTALPGRRRRLASAPRDDRSSSFASARSLPVATLGRTEKQQSATGCCRVRRWLRLLEAGARRATGSLMGVPPPIRASANRDLGVERTR